MWMWDVFSTSRHIECDWWIGIAFLLRSSLVAGKPHGRVFRTITNFLLHTKNWLFSPCWGLLSPTLAALSVLDGLYSILTTKQRHPSLFFLQHGFENPCWTEDNTKMAAAGETLADSRKTGQESFPGLHVPDFLGDLPHSGVYRSSSCPLACAQLAVVFVVLTSSHKPGNWVTFRLLKCLFLTLESGYRNEK